MPETIRIVVADDHPIVRSGLVMNIEREQGFIVVAQATDGHSALTLIDELRPDVAIIDIEMPKLDGLAVARSIIDRGLGAKIIFLTLHKERELFQAAMDAGGSAFLVKDSALDEIAAAIHTVVGGRRYVSSGILDRFLRKETPVQFSASQLLHHLTAAERRILRLIADGKSSKEIGSDLDIHYRTVENHRSNICRKLGIVGSNSLPRFALQYKDKFIT
jgi:DNA-binding NarL/FixJ family response regulator